MNIVSIVELILAGISVIAAVVSARCSWKSQQKSAYHAFDSSYHIVLEELSTIAKTKSLRSLNNVNVSNISSDVQAAEIFDNVWSKFKTLATYVKEYVEAQDCHKQRKLQDIIGIKREHDMLLELFRPWAFALHQCHMIVYENPHLRKNEIFYKRLKHAQTKAMREMFAILIVRIEGDCGMNHVDKDDYAWIDEYVGNNKSLQSPIREAIFRVFTTSLSSEDDIKGVLHEKNNEGERLMRFYKSSDNTAA